MKERLISLAWAAPWMLFMGFPLAYALELPDPAQRAGLIGLCALVAVVNSETWLANPLPALCVGILGTLLGLFSAFMPAWVGYFVPWGYFIPLNTYRIADWDQASKVVTYMIVPFQWPLLVATVVLAGILFFAAWYAMRNKEV